MRESKRRRDLDRDAACQSALSRCPRLMAEASEMDWDWKWAKKKARKLKKKLKAARK